MPSILLNPIGKRTPSTFPNLKLLALPQHSSVKVNFKLNTIAPNAWGYVELQVKCFSGGTYLGYVAAAYQRLYGIENDNRWVCRFSSLEPENYRYELWGRLRSKKAINELVQVDCAIASTLDFPPSADLPFFEVPPGTVIQFAGATVPDGYLMANGDVISRADYSDLFGAIGTIYGAGDGVSTFRLPDLRGEFVRGWDDDRGVDTGRAIGSSQVGMSQINPGVMVRVGSFGTGDGTHDATGVSNAAYANDMSAAPWGNSSTLYPETRPRNIALMFCVKF